MASERLLRHVVLFQFKDNISQAQMAEVGQAFLTLPAQIEAIHDLEWGSVVNDAEQFTHCLRVTVRSQADLKAYSDHPVHQAVGMKFGDLLQNYAVLDYWTGA